MDNIAKFIGINSLYKYGQQANSYDMAKFMAIFFMIIDHLGNFFFPETWFLRGLGRLAFPIFFFLIGYSRYFATSWNLLFIGVAITIYRGTLTGIWQPFDILISAFLVRIIMDILIRKNMLSGINLLVVIFGVVIWHFGVLLIFSYGAIGVLFAICGYLKRLENEGQPQRYLPVIILATVLMDFIFQNLVWDKAINYIDIFSVVSVFLVYYFVSFEVKIINIKNKFLRETIMFFSRNSLFIYWAHFTAFVTLSALLGS